MIVFRISGPYAALMSYLAEVHGDTHRSRVYMWLGVFFSLGNISVPCKFNNLVCVHIQLLISCFFLFPRVDHRHSMAYNSHGLGIEILRWIHGIQLLETFSCHLFDT